MSLSNNNNATKEVGIIDDSNILPGMSTSNKKVEGASKSNDDMLEVIGQLQNMSTADNNASICANCGKEGANNVCNKCKQVKYCNAVCKKVHKKKHKKDCEEHIRLADEHAAELHDIELFKQPPPKEDCPICFQQLPSMDSGRIYMSCCGKEICSGCLCAPVYDNQGNEVDNQKCAFCRTPFPYSDEEGVERGTKRVEAGDAQATFNLGCDYLDGTDGYPKDYNKALELFHRAAELSCAEAYLKIGITYYRGEGVKVDKKKAVYYCELAAIGGCNIARYNLGIEEKKAGNMERALKHHMIAARVGDTNSLKKIQKMYSNGHASKEDYTKALQSYQAYLMEIKSDQRDKAASGKNYQYY